MGMENFHTKNFNWSSHALSSKSLYMKTFLFMLAFLLTFALGLNLGAYTMIEEAIKTGILCETARDPATCWSLEVRH